MFGHENEHYSNHFTTCKNLVLSTYLQKLHGFPIFNYGHFKAKIVNISEVKGDPKNITTQKSLRKSFYINCGGKKKLKLD